MGDSRRKRYLSKAAARVSYRNGAFTRPTPAARHHAGNGSRLHAGEHAHEQDSGLPAFGDFGDPRGLLEPGRADHGRRAAAVGGQHHSDDAFPGLDPLKGFDQDGW